MDRVFINSRVIFSYIGRSMGVWRHSSNLDLIAKFQSSTLQLGLAFLELRWERMGTNVLTDWTPALACLDRRGSKQSTRITLWLWWMGWGRYLSMTAPMMWLCPAMGSPLVRSTLLPSLRF